MSANTKEETEAAQKLAEERERAASEKFAKNSNRHRHHWPIRSAAGGELSIGRCECGEPYPRGTEVAA